MLTSLNFARQTQLMSANYLIADVMYFRLDK